MTLVMVWTEGSDRWWVVSDSRISGSERPLTDAGAKILEIPVTLYEGNDGPLGKPLKTTTLGFAFCGSTLVALQAYAAVLPLWSRLQNAPFNVLPSMADLAHHLAFFVGAYSKEIGSGCQCLLMGLDHTVDALECWVIDAKLADGAPTVQKIEKPDGIATYGSGAPQARNEINFLKGDIQFPQWKRQPLKLIRHIVLKNALDKVSRHDVGGGVQIGLLTKQGFELHFDVQDSPASGIIPSFKYRGFNVMDVTRVGPCIAIMRGVSG